MSIPSQPTTSNDSCDRLNSNLQFTATAGPMPKDVRSIPRHLSIIQQAYRLRNRESIQQKQYPQGLGRYILVTTEGNTTDDLQGSWEIDHNYAASTNLRDTNYRNIQYTQNEALGIATGCHKMYTVDHLHIEAEMRKVRDHSELLSALYLARCLEPEKYRPLLSLQGKPLRDGRRHYSPDIATL